MGESILIIDLGTTNIKAVVFDLRGNTVFECTRPTPFIYDGESMEVDPEALWQTAKTVCREAASGVKRPVSAISMSSMAASFIPLDASGKPLHPAIGWADGRSIPYMRQYMEHFLAGGRIEGCGQYPLQMYLPFKMEWFKRNHPQAAAKTARWLNVSEYIYAKLTGDDRYCTDYSIASRTLLFDIGGKRWNSRALRFFDVDETTLPDPLPAGTVIGMAGEELRSIGFDARTPVVMGGHDHMCGVPGAGICDANVVLNTTGTSEAIVSLLPSPDFRTEMIVSTWLNCEAGLQRDKVAVVGYVGASGRVYQSIRESIGSFDNAGLDPAADGMPVFLPPQRAQLTSVGGELRGIHPIFDAPLLFRAMCDGLYLESRRMLERILLVKGADGIGSMRMVGGHTKNPAEVRRKSAAMGLPLEIVRQPNISSVGAAVAAGAGCGLFASFEEAIASLCQGNVEYVEPDQALMSRFDELYREKYLPCFENGIESL